MHNPEDRVESRRPPAKASALSVWRGRGAGCLVAILGFVAFDVVFYGVGQPYAYRYHIGPTQIFEGVNGLVIFTEVDLETFRPGFVRSPAFVREPVRLYRINLGRDGAMTRLRLIPPRGKTFHLGFEPILKLPDGEYVLEPPYLGHPAPQLHRLRGGQFEPLSVEESGLVLGSVGYTGEREGETDLVTEQNGWRLLDRTSRHWLDPEPVVSQRHQIRLRVLASDAAESMTAESIRQHDRWTVTLLSISARQWRSYGKPPDLQ